MYHGFEDVKDIMHSICQKVNNYKKDNNTNINTKSTKKETQSYKLNNDSVLFTSISLFFRCLCIFLKEIYYSF